MTKNKAFEIWIKNQPIWHDSDMWKAFAVGIVVGVFFGFLWGYNVGAPDLSGIVHTGIKG